MYEEGTRLIYEWNGKKFEVEVCFSAEKGDFIGYKLKVFEIIYDFTGNPEGRPGKTFIYCERKHAKSSALRVKEGKLAKKADK